MIDALCRMCGAAEWVQGGVCMHCAITTREKERIEDKMTDDKITKSPGVCGGDACIAGTRIPVWVIIRHMKWGVSETIIQQAYPQLTSGQIRACWDYYLKNTEEIEAQIKENDE